MGKKKDQHAPALKKPALKPALKSVPVPSEQQLITATTAKRNVFFKTTSGADKAAKSSAEEAVSPNVS